MEGPNWVGGEPWLWSPLASCSLNLLWIIRERVWDGQPTVTTVAQGGGTKVLHADKD